MKRSVKISQEKDSIIGAWSIMCATCPLLPHLKALDKPAIACGSGIRTKIQGPVVMATCEHYAEESIDVTNGKVTIECGKE